MRNRWQRIEKGRKLREEGSNLKNRCHACGEPKRGHICYAKMRGGPQVDLPTPQGGNMPPPMPGSSSMMSGGSAASGSMYASAGGSMQPPLKRTRSGSKLVPDDRAGPSFATGLVSHGFSVDVDNAPAPLGQPALLRRTNTSFFRDLVASDLFSPNSREMFQAWADSPRDNGTPGRDHPSGLSVAAAVAADSNAPQSLKRVASHDGSGPVEPPKLTRSLTSYLKEISDSSAAPSGQSPTQGGGGHFGGAGPTLLPSSLSRQASLNRQPSALSRQPSNVQGMLGGRNMSSFVRDFLDESEQLGNAPPPNALPPVLQTSASLNPGELSDAALGLDLGGNGGLGSLGGGLGSLGSALGAPPPLSRRSSRNVDSPSRH